MKNISAIFMVVCEETRTKLQPSARNKIQFGGFQVWRAGLLLCAGLLGLSIASVCRAQVSGSEDASLYGQLGQLNNAVVAGNNNQGQAIANWSCFAASAANGLIFLEKYQQNINQPDPFDSSPNTYATINTLIPLMGITAKGTAITPAFNGLVSYLSPTGANPSPTVSVTGQYGTVTPAGFLGGVPGASIANATPTAAFLAGALNANKAVELTFQWGTLNGNVFTVGSAGHEVALTALSLAANNTGTITYMDPGQPGSTTGTLMDANLILGSDGYLDISGAKVHSSGIGAGNDPDNNTTDDSTFDIGAGFGAGRIVADMIEAVPEPASSTIIIAAALIGLAFRGWRHKAARISR
jgi:hypothetical protein